jgi:hypothetical protein
MLWKPLQSLNTKLRRGGGKNWRAGSGLHDLVTVFNIDPTYGECRQATIPKDYQFWFVSMAALEPGGCYSHGFRDALGTETFSMPFLGDVPIKVFKKTEMSTPAMLFTTAFPTMIASLTGLVAFGVSIFAMLFLGGSIKRTQPLLDSTGDFFNHPCPGL